MLRGERNKEQFYTPGGVGSEANEVKTTEQ